MKKLSLVIAIISLFVCIFALSVSADGIVANTITSETYGTVYQLSQDPGLDGAKNYVSTLNTIEDKGSDTEALAILTDGEYYYVFPSSYIVEEILTGSEKGKFSLLLTKSAGSSTAQKGVNVVFAEWNEAEGTSLPEFAMTPSYGNTTMDSLVRFTVPTDVLYFDSNHCRFRGAELVEVRMNHSLRMKGGGLFSGCAKLTTVIGYDTMTNVNSATNMFTKCSSLVSVKFPADTTSIGKEMFQDCALFTGIENWDEIKNNVKSIGNYAFYNCDSLASISLPAVTSIGSAAFGYCDGLVTVDLAGSSFVKLNSAFRNCTKLESIDLPDTVDGISQDGFHACKALTYFRVPAAATYIGAYAFNGCSSLATFDMTDAVNLKSTGGNTFSGAGITELIFPEGFESFGGFGSANKLTYVYFPNSTKTLSGIQSGKMPTYTIPLGVTTLNSKTLDYCSTHTVTIHKGVTTVSSQAFYGTSVKTIYYTGSESDAVVEQIKVAAPKAEIICVDQCETYFEGHAWSGNAVMQAVDYFAGVFFADTCTRDDCGVASIDDSKTIGALFVDYGYSATEVAINGVYAMSQFYGINKANIEAYKAVTGVGFEFGLVVSVSDKPMDAENEGLIDEGKTYVTPERFIVHDCFTVTVSGFTAKTADRALTYCAFVNDGDSVYYLDGGKTVDTVAQKSLNQIRELLGYEKISVEEEA